MRESIASNMNRRGFCISWGRLLFFTAVLNCMLILPALRAFAGHGEAQNPVTCLVEYRFAPACYNAKGETIRLGCAEPLTLPDAEELPVGSLICGREDYGQGPGWEPVYFRLSERGRRREKLTFPLRISRDEKIEIAFFTPLSYSGGGPPGVSLPAETKVEYGCPVGEDRLPWLFCKGYQFAGWYWKDKVLAGESSLVLEAYPCLRAGWRTEAVLDLAASLDERERKTVSPRWRCDESEDAEKRVLLDAFSPGCLADPGLLIEPAAGYGFLGFSTALHGRPVSESYMLEQPGLRFYAQYVCLEKPVLIRIGVGAHGKAPDTSALEWMADGTRTMEQLFPILWEALAPETEDASGIYVLKGFCAESGEMLREGSELPLFLAAGTGGTLYLRGIYERKDSNPGAREIAKQRVFLYTQKQ